MTRSLFLLLSLLPGASPILLGHGVLGSLLMAVGLLGWNALLVGFFLWQGVERAAIGWTGVAVGPTCTLVSLVWTIVATSPRRKARHRALAERALAVAHNSFLRDNLRGAWIAVETGLRGARDDVDLLFVGWILSRRMKELKRSRRFLARLRRLDVDDKWTWEIHREMTEPHASASFRPAEPPEQD